MEKAVLDANVLYGALLRDVLLRLAQSGLYRPFWSDLLQEEWMRAAVRNGSNAALLGRVQVLMENHFPDARVFGFEHRIASISAILDPDDRHVVAAALHAGADVIVTLNMKDFPAAALTAQHQSLRVESPDVFLCNLKAKFPEAVTDTLRRHRAILQKPPRTSEEYCADLRRIGLPLFADMLTLDAV